MIATQISDDRLELNHDGVASARPMLWIVVACVAAVAVAALLQGSFWSLLLVLAVGSLLVALLRRSSAESRAVFDRRAGTVTISHCRGGTEIERIERPLGDISSVIVEAAGRSRRNDNVLTLRPALLVGTDIVPLTWRAFVSGDSAVDAALAVRRFLGAPEGNLFADSVEALARHSDRTNPAVRIARLGMGLGRREAAELVTRLRKTA